MQKHLIRLWDLPTRSVHWLLFALVTAAFVTGLAGGNLMLWHGRCGLAILGVLTFRLVWGLVGSTYARFGQFVRGPGTIVAYLRGQWHGVGHNPLGALSVLALLGLLLWQTLSGLAANDDIAFKGPLYALATDELSAWLTGRHRQTAWILAGLIGLHLGAVLFYAFARQDNLLAPMLTGRRMTDAADATSATGGGPLAVLLALALAALAVWIAAGGLLAPPPPPSALPGW